MNGREHIWGASSFGDGEEKCILCGGRKVDIDCIAELEGLLRRSLVWVGEEYLGRHDDPWPEGAPALRKDIKAALARRNP